MDHLAHRYPGPARQARRGLESQALHGALGDLLEWLLRLGEVDDTPAATVPGGLFARLRAHCREELQELALKEAEHQLQQARTALPDGVDHPVLLALLRRLRGLLGDSCTTAARPTSRPTGCGC